MSWVELLVQGCRARFWIVDRSREILEAIVPVDNPIDRHGQLDLCAVAGLGETGEGQGIDQDALALLHIRPASGQEQQGPYPRFAYALWYYGECLADGLLPESEEDWYFHEVLVDAPVGGNWTADRVIETVRQKVLPLLERAIRALNEGRPVDLEKEAGWTDEDELERLRLGRLPRMRFWADFKVRGRYRYLKLLPADHCCWAAWAINTKGERFAGHLRSREHLETIYGPERAERFERALQEQALSNP